MSFLSSVLDSIGKGPAETTKPPIFHHHRPSERNQQNLHEEHHDPTRAGKGSVRSHPATGRTPPVGSIESKGLKKGSYKEIMARAQAAAAAQKNVNPGMIKHKASERQSRISKKSILQKDRMQKSDAQTNGERRNLTNKISTTSTAGKSVLPAEPRRKERQFPPLYKGTMRARAGPSKRTAENRSSTERSDIEDEDSDSAESVSRSDYSDDMEAAFSDVEREESAAAMQARLEDEEEARLENKLKMEKAARKRYRSS